MYESETRTMCESETRNMDNHRRKIFNQAKSAIGFLFPELAPNKNITWIMHVDNKTSKETALYDMIIGMNLMTEIGTTVDTFDKVIRWEGNILPLKTKNVLQTNEQCNMLHGIMHRHS
jgi:hypothetical protein